MYYFYVRLPCFPSRTNMTAEVFSWRGFSAPAFRWTASSRWDKTTWWVFCTFNGVTKRLFRRSGPTWTRKRVSIIYQVDSDWMGKQSWNEKIKILQIWRVSPKRHITTSAVLDKDMFCEPAKVSEVKNPLVRIGEDVYILDAQVLCMRPAGIETGGKSRWNHGTYAIHCQAAEYGSTVFITSIWQRPSSHPLSLPSEWPRATVSQLAGNFRHDQPPGPYSRRENDGHRPQYMHPGFRKGRLVSSADLGRDTISRALLETSPCHTLSLYICLFSVSSLDLQDFESLVC